MTSPTRDDVAMEKSFPKSTATGKGKRNGREPTSAPSNGTASATAA
eukprot:CAMPEP_0119521474 /NCGR_PEP_ID=MMETSP1344-20130328/37165_1 /TAXON_ID=236787 /ORGANISM="Florenciella parvula, Strain CCMP2471" /LENGTH=45 /DNA_ID= /DNA_START= /DNA_END= /DNA_ORIENTATION=